MSAYASFSNVTSTDKSVTVCPGAAPGQVDLRSHVAATGAFVWTGALASATTGVIPGLYSLLQPVVATVMIQSGAITLLTAKAVAINAATAVAPATYGIIFTMSAAVAAGATTISYIVGNPYTG